MILFAQIAADEEAKLTKLDSANRAQSSVHTLLDLCRVDGAEVRLSVNPHLYEWHGVAAAGFPASRLCLLDSPDSLMDIFRFYVKSYRTLVFGKSKRQHVKGVKAIPLQRVLLAYYQRRTLILDGAHVVVTTGRDYRSAML
jgi:hypothetical protein